MEKKNVAATIITAIVALLAVGAVVTLLILKGQEHTSDPEQFVPTDEVRAEMENNAGRLIKNNYTVFSLYLQNGLSFKTEPYGNIPEDELYEVLSYDYDSLEDIEKIVDETFVEEEAKRIKENVSGKGRVYSEKTTIDGEKVIGLNVNMVEDNAFKGIDYEYSWTNAQFMVEPVSNTECVVTIMLEKIGDESAAPRSIETEMLKVNGVWYLTDLAY